MNQISITFSDGCLGSHNDEGRSKLRYAMWFAEIRESSDRSTQMALFFLEKYARFSVLLSLKHHQWMIFIYSKVDNSNYITTALLCVLSFYVVYYYADNVVIICCHRYHFMMKMVISFEDIYINKHYDMLYYS